MAVFYPNMYYNKVCYGGTALYSKVYDCDSNVYKPVILSSKPLFIESY